MRILFVSTWFPYPPSNGSKLRAYYLLQALAARHAVTALAFCPPSAHGQTASAAPAGATPISAVPDDPFGQIDVPEWERFVTITPPAYRPSAAMQQAVAALRDQGPWDAAVAVQLFAARYVLPVTAAVRVVDVDTALSYQMHERLQAEREPRARLRAWLSYQKARRYEARMLHSFQAATVVWKAEVDLLQSMANGSGCKVSVSPNGVDCVRNQPVYTKPAPAALVYNGSLTYSANFDAMQWFLAEVYPQLKAQVPDVTLTITGSTEGVDVTQLRLDDSVHLTGFVDDVRLPVAHATLCVAPIRQGGGTRVKILEAMSLGTPVISTTKGAEGLNVTAGEHLLLADDAGTFANTVVTLLHDPARRATLAANARRLVEQCYDWRAIGASFVELVEAAHAHKAT